MRKLCARSILLFSSVFFVKVSSAQYRVDSSAIVTLIANDYKTVANSDTLQHRRNCTYDYKLVEEGEIWNMEQEMSYIKEKSATRQTRSNAFTINSVTINSATAYAVYFLRSRITQRDGSSKNYHWLETAILRKVGNQWKIALIHSTKMPE